ncbi:MAG: hypothetical protein KIS67_20300 [Verrucomicrobiae bacterium]|nr:hypothetical protein [Verrucomicrobiae bacterium]
MNWRQISPLALIGLGVLLMWWLLTRGKSAATEAGAARQAELDAIQ